MAAPLVLVVEHQLHVFRRFWRGALVMTFISPLLFLGAIGWGLGGMVDHDVAGLSYLSFVTPGLVAASAMQASAAQALWPVMAGIKWMGSFRAMVATPIAPAQVYGGVVIWNALRSCVGAGAFLGVAALLGGVRSPWAVLAVPAAALCAAAFAAPITAFSATQQTDLKFPVIMRFGIIPLFLFSGTFFPVEDLPAAVEPFARLSPLWHGVELCRAATTGSVDGWSAAGHVVVLAGCVAAGWAWGTRSFTRRLAA